MFSNKNAFVAKIIKAIYNEIITQYIISNHVRSEIVNKSRD